MLELSHLDLLVLLLLDLYALHAPALLAIVGVELPSFAAHPLEGVQVPGLVQVLLPLLRYPALRLQLGAGLSSL